MKRLIGVPGIGLALVACSPNADQPRATSSVPSESAPPSPTTSSTPARDLSVIYGVGSYGYHGYYRFTIGGTAVSKIPADWFGPYAVHGSPDGRYLARFEYGQEPVPQPTADLEIASSSAPGMFKRIARPATPSSPRSFGAETRRR